MEPSRSLEASQKCFLPIDQVPAQGNETFLCDEAEPLVYVCSETSMPPRSAGNMGVIRRADTSAPGGKSPSNTSRKSRKSSTLMHDTEECIKHKTIRSSSAEGVTLSKLDELETRPNSNGSKLEECMDSDGLGSFNADAKTKNIENKEEDLEEIFIHNKKFFTSSSESERVRISSEELQEEVFSTGISDIEEVNHEDIKQKCDKRAQFSRKSIDTSGLPPSFATKSIIKNMNRTFDRPAAHESPNRKSSPVQHRLSLRAMTKPPCFLLLDEIRKNNLVLKEDIYTSSSHKVGEFLATQAKNEDSMRRRQKSRDDNNTSKQESSKLSNKQRTLIGTTATKTDISRRLMITTEAVEVYETTGKDNVVVDKVKQNQGRRCQDSCDVNALAVDIHYERKRYEDFWRPLHGQNRNYECEQSNESIEPTKRAGSLSPKELSVIEITEDPKPLASYNPSNNHLQTKPSTPYRRPERYVKLPGLVEAFSQQNSHFKDLRIKDGMSFSSVNALQEMSMRNATTNTKDIHEFKDFSMKNIANQTQESSENHRPFCSLGVEEKVTIQNYRHKETKDAATDIRIPLVNTKTQTGNLGKTTIDCSVQCESFAVDEANGRNAKKNRHQEIMICNDTGDGVQLYNELGHPLTDMGGYLLKDSLGRFLVRLDHFGIPVSCTNGQAIFMEDFTPWDEVKSNMSVIHQSRKKPIKRDAGTKKGKARSSLHHLETAMKNLENTLGLANKIPLDTGHGNLLERLTYFGEGKRGQQRKMKPTLETNNTTSLIAEMKSIARLRNALLEKINFIADNRNKFGEMDKKHALLGRKKSPNHSYNKNVLDDPDKNVLDDPISILARQERTFSPTFQAMKKLVENEGMKEADDWMNFRGAGITPNSIKTSDDPISILASQERLFSPTFEAMNKLVENAGMKEADEWMNVRGAGITPDWNKTLGNHKDVILDYWTEPVNAKSFGSDLAKEKKCGRNQVKTVSWIDALPGNSLITNSPVFQKADENEVEVKDLWTLRDNSQDKFNPSITETNCNEGLKIFQENGYQDIDKEIERLEMKLVSKDKENTTGVSGLEQVPSKDGAFKGSQLLISLEKQYNLREGSWFETFDPPISRRPEGDPRYGTIQGRNSEMRPRIEFSSSSSNNF